MTDNYEDILIDIPDDDLPKLAEMYEKHKDWAPHVHSTIMTGIDWRKKGVNMKFMSPNDCWREDGTFFVILSYYGVVIFTFSLDESSKNIYEGVLKTKRFQAGLLFSIFNKHFEIVTKALVDKGTRVTVHTDPSHMYCIPAEEALTFEIAYPPDVYIKKLESIHAGLINSVWPHRFDNSEKYIKLLIDVNDSCGVFLKSNDELISWALLSMMGQLTVVQTADAHKRKGYGSLTVKYLSKIIAKKGENPCGTIMETNFASLKMFEKLGFRMIGIAMYANVP